MLNEDPPPIAKITYEHPTSNPPHTHTCTYTHLFEKKKYLELCFVHVNNVILPVTWLERSRKPILHAKSNLAGNQTPVYIL